MKKTIAIIQICSLTLLLLAIHPKESFAQDGSGSLLGLAGDFNLFTIGDLTLSYGEAEGRVAAGGNAMLNGYNVNSNHVPGTYGLIADGSLTTSNMQVSGGQVAYGEDFSGSGYYFGGEEPEQASVIDFGATEAFLKELSNELKELPVNGDTIHDYDGLLLQGNHEELNVFHIDEDIATLTLDAPLASTVIINVAGPARSMGTAFYFDIETERDTGAALNRQNKVLFNFYEATTLSIGSAGVEGSVLAPYAAVSTTFSHIDGILAAHSLSGHIEAHHHPFIGNISLASPEPATGIWRHSGFHNIVKKAYLALFQAGTVPVEATVPTEYSEVVSIWNP